MKTLLAILIVLFIGTSVTFAQQNTSTKSISGKSKLVKAGTVVKSVNKTNVSASKSNEKSVTVNSNQTTATNNDSRTSKKPVRIPVRGGRKSVSAKSVLKEK